MKFLFNIIAAIAFITWGYIYYTDGWSYRHGFTVSKIPGIALVFIGGLFLINAIRKRNFKSVYDYLICRGCLTTYIRSELKNNSCPKCEGSLYELDGFYERHPEFKSKKKT